MSREGALLYRGCGLTEEEIKSYENMVGKTYRTEAFHEEANDYVL